MVLLIPIWIIFFFALTFYLRVSLTMLTPSFQWDWIDSLSYLVWINLSRFRRKKTKHLKFYNSNIDTYKPIKLSFKILSDILQGVKWSNLLEISFFLRQPSQPTFFDSILKVTSFIYEFTHKISGSWLKITVNLSELEKLCVNNGIVERMDVSC